MDDALDMWVIYEHPKDYPDKFVARLWKITKVDVPTGTFFLGETQTEVEAKLPPGLFWMPRHENDDACIIGVWF
jgi:hypothetical protein